MFKKHTRSKKFVLTLLLLPVLSFAGFAATTYFFGVLSPSTNIGALTTASQGLSGSMQAIQDALTGLTNKFNTEQQNHQDDLAQAQAQIQKLMIISRRLMPPLMLPIRLKRPQNWH